MSESFYVFVKDLPLPALIISVVVIGLVLLLMAVAAIFSGIHLKIAGHAIGIGGIRDILFKKRDEDRAIRENLKKEIDEIDHEARADMFDLVYTVGIDFEKLLVDKHCHFSMDAFRDILKDELNKRVRRNNLKKKLVEQNVEQYIKSILTAVSEQYGTLQKKAVLAQCAEQYPDFSEIESGVKDILRKLFDDMKKALIKRCNEKIVQYEKTRKSFQDQNLAIEACDEPIERNRKYIEDLGQS
jgi:hypothetical protein